MAKFTRVQRSEIEYALRHAQRAMDYVMRPNIAVAHRGNAAGGTTLDYWRADGAMLSEVAKEYGSDLCGLADAIKSLQRLLS